MPGRHWKRANNDYLFKRRYTRTIAKSYSPPPEGLDLQRDVLGRTHLLRRQVLNVTAERAIEGQDKHADRIRPADTASARESRAAKLPKSHQRSGGLATASGTANQPEPGTGIRQDRKLLCGGIYVLQYSHGILGYAQLVTSIANSASAATVATKMSGRTPETDILASSRGASLRTRRCERPSQSVCGRPMQPATLSRGPRNRTGEAARPARVAVRRSRCASRCGAVRPRGNGETALLRWFEREIAGVEPAVDSLWLTPTQAHPLDGLSTRLVTPRLFAALRRTRFRSTSASASLAGNLQIDPRC